MSQEAVRELLHQLGGEATTREIAVEAKEQYPDRTLHTYIGQILRRLEEKGIVTKNDEFWSLTEFGRETSIEGVPISDIDVGITEEDLRNEGLDIANIVATIDFDRELDLLTLSNDLSNANYHPESSPFLVYRPRESQSVTLLVPTNGMISVVGAKSKQELIEGTQLFIDDLVDLGIEVTASPSDALVQNTVLSGDLGVELELSAVVIGLGLEGVEYEPEQFPGIIYRIDGSSTGLVFRTGKFLINGSKSYVQALDSANHLRRSLKGLGIDVD